MTPQYRMLDLFAGQLGWAKGFAAKGWECVCVDLVEPKEIPHGCTFEKRDILSIGRGWDWERYANRFDFICASSPCEEFSKWGMRCFFPSPPYPATGIRLFNHTRELCETSGRPYLMENVRAAQDFVGPAKGHCGPFYLWGNAVPTIVPQGVIKGMTRRALGHYDYAGEPGWNTKNERAESRQNEDQAASLAASIPPELAATVSDYAERLLEQKQAGIVACHERSGS